MSEIICYAVIGTGAMGQEHIRYLAMLDGVRVAAIADPDKNMRAKAAQLAGDDVACFADYRQLLAAGSADAYIIATPNYTHIDVLADVVETGKPVLVEKPLCTSVSDCRKAIARAAAANAAVWVAMEYRFMPPLAKMIEQIQSGAIGALKMITIREHRRPFLQKVGDWNRFARNTGGTLVEKCCHFFDLMRLMAGSEPLRVFASGAQDVNHLDEKYNGETPDIIDNAFVIVDFAGGQRAMLELCMFAEGAYYEQTVTATGDKARIEAFVPRALQHEPGGIMRPAKVVLAQRETGEENTEEFALDEKLLTAGAHFGSTYYEHLGFLDMVRTARPPAVSLYDGLAAVAVGEAAETSVRTGKPVRIDLPVS